MSSQSTDSSLSFLGFLEPDQRQMLEEAPRQNRIPLLAQLKRKSEMEVLVDLAKDCDLAVLEDFEVPDDAAEILPLRVMHEYQCLPLLGEHEDPLFLELVTVWPPSEEMTEWILAVSGKEPKWHLGPANRISDTITQRYGVGADSLSESDIATEDSGRLEEAEEDENAALIRFVNEVIAKAVDDRATDIHFEPLKESLQIRYRIDGELVPIRVPDNLIRYQGAIISRLKIMAKLNISEKRRPQDGRIVYKAKNTELDIRISTMPTMYGESVSLRLLNQKNQPLSMEELGMLKNDQNRIKRVLDLPYGIILVTGPTGSGKSTSLTAFIRQINSPGRRIITVEDPVEYEVEGVNQTQVHSEIGFTFASALRHILRQDPDVIMVGEVRDSETADIAIRAALTGHLVLSTLHTNDAPGALTRLIDMEIEPFLIASAVEMILAQRLVRRLCAKCAQQGNYTEHYLRECLDALNLEPTPERLAAKILEPIGCEACRGLGYRGRVGIFEILRVDDTIHELIVQKLSAGEIRQEALKHGMTTLQMSGWDQLALGRTSLNEIMRYSTGEEDTE
ncbi:type II/IV secretion system protein [Puniceicoccales bacterium CK1056]|uniref:Type II/IV secretion system protein n=1 Tax=Oceanipulchritudo coccoides TaxID=2706888 RepID=A0A6B2M2S8_9BACT|nr:GspE/PulE family protein [Oceanipulchritudo coccoides]NDV62499.1 type II/IV secretion system protein [Oceanipulchritudo coccoides]